MGDERPVWSIGVDLDSERRNGLVRRHLLPTQNTAILYRLRSVQPRQQTRGRREKKTNTKKTNFTGTSPAPTCKLSKASMEWGEVMRWIGRRGKGEEKQKKVRSYFCPQGQCTSLAAPSKLQATHKWIKPESSVNMKRKSFHSLFFSSISCSISFSSTFWKGKKKPNKKWPSLHLFL